MPTIINLLHGEKALVDEDKFNYLKAFNWYAVYSGKTFYAYSMQKTESGWRRIGMHRMILGLKMKDNLVVDHINFNGLDNRKSNLRICTPQQNAMHKRQRLNKTSQYKGVSWSKRQKKWKAMIGLNSHDYYLGYFDSEIEAAHVYDTKAKELFKEFSNPNFL